MKHEGVVHLRLNEIKYARMSMQIFTFVQWQYCKRSAHSSIKMLFFFAGCVFFCEETLWVCLATITSQYKSWTCDSLHLRTVWPELNLTLPEVCEPWCRKSSWCLAPNDDDPWFPWSSSFYAYGAPLSRPIGQRSSSNSAGYESVKI